MSQGIFEKWNYITTASAFLIRMRNIAINDCQGKCGERNEGSGCGSGCGCGCECGSASLLMVGHYFTGILKLSLRFTSRYEYLQQHSQFTTNSGMTTLLRGIYEAIPPPFPFDHYGCAAGSGNLQSGNTFELETAIGVARYIRGVVASVGVGSAQANLYVTQFMYLQNIRCHCRDLDAYIGSRVYNPWVPIHL